MYAAYVSRARKWWATGSAKEMAVDRGAPDPFKRCLRIGIWTPPQPTPTRVHSKQPPPPQLTFREAIRVMSSLTQTRGCFEGLPFEFSYPRRSLTRRPKEFLLKGSLDEKLPRCGRLKPDKPRNDKVTRLPSKAIAN